MAGFPFGTASLASRASQPLLDGSGPHETECSISSLAARCRHRRRRRSTSSESTPAPCVHPRKFPSGIGLPSALSFLLQA
eukprot:3371125-Prymnesium_polylepis.2